MPLHRLFQPGWKGPVCRMRNFGPAQHRYRTGQINPLAVGALPVLQEIRKQEALEQEADNAILRINGKSPATWHGEDCPE